LKDRERPRDQTHDCINATTPQTHIVRRLTLASYRQEVVSTHYGFLYVFSCYSQIHPPFLWNHQATTCPTQTHHPLVLHQGSHWSSLIQAYSWFPNPTRRKRQRWRRRRSLLEYRSGQPWECWRIGTCWCWEMRRGRCFRHRRVRGEWSIDREWKEREIGCRAVE
jgi:hypothetical protein